MVNATSLNDLPVEPPQTDGRDRYRHNPEGDPEFAEWNQFEKFATDAKPALNQCRLLSKAGMELVPPG